MIKGGIVENVGWKGIFLPGDPCCFTGSGFDCSMAFATANEYKRHCIKVFYAILTRGTTFVNFCLLPGQTGHFEKDSTQREKNLLLF